MAYTSGGATGDDVKRRTLLRGTLGVTALLVFGRGRISADSSTERARVGEVSGTAFAPGRSPSSPEVPLTGLTLVLLPRSAPLLDGLERIRRQSRGSLPAHRSAIPEMRRLVEATMTDLRAAGQTAAIRSSTVDAGGRFALTEVPAGDWVLIGYRSVHVDRASQDTAKESGTFLPQPRLVGYDRVMVWLRALAVEPGRPEVVEFTDRNVWFEGVEEKTAARDRAPSTGGRRPSAR